MSPAGLRPAPPLLRFALHPSSDLVACWRAHRSHGQGPLEVKRRHVPKSPGRRDGESCRAKSRRRRPQAVGGHERRRALRCPGPAREVFREEMLQFKAMLSLRR